MRELRKEGNTTKMRQILTEKLREKLAENRRKISMTELFWMDNFMGGAPYIFGGNEIHCSCIVAKQGDSVVRYIKFLENKDPVTFSPWWPGPSG